MIRAPSHARSSRGGLPVWQALSRLVIGLIVVIILVLAALAFQPQIKRHAEERREIRRLEDQVQSEQELIRMKKKELDLLQSSPEYVEIIARDKMDMMKEGEVIFRIEASTTPSATP